MNHNLKDPRDGGGVVSAAAVFTAYWAKKLLHLMVFLKRRGRSTTMKIMFFDTIKEPFLFDVQMATQIFLLNWCSYVSYNLCISLLLSPYYLQCTEFVQVLSNYAFRANSYLRHM